VPPKVSVNICCYNAESFIAETINSVLKQTFADLEIIVIDDGSQDKTGQIIKSITDPRIKYVYQENKGLSRSRNIAIGLSAGEYIALLDHDDVWLPDKLELQVALLESAPNIGLVYSDSYFINDKGITSGTFFDFKEPYKGSVTCPLFLGNFIPCLTTVMRKRILTGIELFRTDLTITEEYDLFLRLSIRTQFDFVNRPLAKYRVHATNTSRNMQKGVFEETAVLEHFYHDHSAVLDTCGNSIKQRLRAMHWLRALYERSSEGNIITASIARGTLFSYQTIKPLIKKLIRNIKYG
jgi:glycosyltransferase involved in cell wall biosynthesis